MFIIWKQKFLQVLESVSKKNNSFSKKSNVDNRGHLVDNIQRRHAKYCDDKEYKLLNRIVQQRCRSDREASLNWTCNENQKPSNHYEAGTVHKKIRRFQTKNSWHQRERWSVMSDSQKILQSSISYCVQFVPRRRNCRSWLGIAIKVTHEKRAK